MPLKERLLDWLVRSSGVILAVGSIGVTLFVPDSASLATKFVVLCTVVVVVGIIEYAATDRRLRRLTDDKLDTICSDFVFPRVRETFHSEIGRGIPVRVNVMMYRRRSYLPFRGRSWNPLRSSLQIDFCDGEYGKHYEDQLEWFAGEGVCGHVVSRRTMIATSLKETQQGEWGMTPEQYNTTRHLGGLISVPIYADEDENRSEVIGVLNIDTEVDVEQQELQDAAEELRNYANYIGVLA
jgi:hypothetical protein